MKRVLLLLIFSACFTSYAQQNEINFPHQRINFSAAPRTALNPMSIKMWDNYADGGPSTYGTVLEFYGQQDHQTGQLYFGGWDNSKIRYREAFYSQNSWSDWVTLLDSKNNLESMGSLKLYGAGAHFISDGNFGVGTTVPSAKLHVNGSQILAGDLTFANDLTPYYIKGPGNGGAIRLRSNVGNDVDRNVQFGNIDNSGTWHSYMVVESSGNVGIGTTTPTEKLSVNGKIRAKEIKVEATGWPDYVFEENYKITSLAELESFIKKHKHLPEVPSAKEVEQNGVELGKMNKLLLKKIEELTLHMIEKDKTMSELIKRIDQLEKYKENEK